MTWVTERVQTNDTQFFGDVHDGSQGFGRVAVSTIVCKAQAVLDFSATALVGISPVLELALQSEASAMLLHHGSWRDQNKEALSKQLCGRKPVGQEIRALIFRMAAENPTWEHPAFTASC